MPAVVDLEKASAVAAVADDIMPGVSIRAAGLLGCDGREELGIEPMAASRASDLRASATPSAASLDAAGSMFMAAFYPPATAFDKVGRGVLEWQKSVAALPGRRGLIVAVA